MSLAPTKILRVQSSRLWFYAVLALSKDLPLPQRLTYLELLEVHLDQLLSPATSSKVWRTIRDNIEYVVSFMRDKGYDIEAPKPSKPLEEGLAEQEELDYIVKWFRKEFKRKDGEPVTTYVNRVSLLAVRLLAIFNIITADLF